MGWDQTEKGLVLKIERSSIHDGQGLRTVVFLKGCPLRCLWCSTPESQEPIPEKGYDKNRCENCGRCINARPEDVLSIKKGCNGIQSDLEKHRSLSNYIDECPTGALKGYGTYVSVRNVVKEISKDEVFYFHSEGGVTLSGGEPLSQPHFTAAVLKECKMLGIHRAMETSLFASWESIEGVLPWLDVLYVDIKLMDNGLHRQWTGVENGLIHENLRRIDDSVYDIEIIVRIPMIPGITDTDENLSETAEFVKSIKKLKSIELLPYHRLGVETYRYLGREYPLKDLHVPSREAVAEKERFLLHMFRP